MQNIKQEQTALQCINEYSDMLHAYAVQHVSETHSAKDIVQKTFLAAWRNIHNYNGDASLKAWLFTILKNKIIDHYRKSSLRLGKELVLSDDKDSYYFESDTDLTDEASPKDWGITPTTRVETKEFYSILSSCRSKLKEIQNAVFSLKCLNRFDSEEICKILKISSSNYWVLINRDKVQLRACLEKNWFVK